jgi:ABC-type antimicrobial peptide transport system permease subunit
MHHMSRLKDIKYALRHILRYKEYSLLNVIGLALGMASAILILLWIEHEIRTDKFHKNGKDIYVLYKILKNSNGTTSFDYSMTGPFAPVIEKEIPEVVAAVRVTWNYQLLFRLGNKMFYEDGFYADSSFFQVFSFPLITGNSKTALNEPNTVVISEKLAKKYFNKENAVGKTILIRGKKEELFTITGVFKDVPSYSTLKFDYVIPFGKYYEYNQDWIQWYNFNMRTFIQAQPNTTIAVLDQKLNEVYDQHGVWELPEFFVQPFEDLHLYGDFKESKENPSGLILYIKIFTLVAIFIIFLASMNYTNLATAIATRRGKEVGVKKVFGSGRRYIFRQFTLEATTLTFIAFILSIIMVIIILPYFNRLIDAHLNFSLRNPRIILIALVVPLFTGILSGIFPAIYMSSFKPITILNSSATPSKGLPKLRQTLVVTQFVITIAFIISSLLIFKQLKFIQNKTLGLNEENVVYFPQSLYIREHRETFKQELEKQPGIISVTYTSDSPLQIGSNTYGASWRGKDPEYNILVPYIQVDADFSKTFDVDIIAGRDFEKIYATDTNSVLINQKFANLFGLEDPVGEVIDYWGRKANVIGVVKDFHIGSLRIPIQQLLIINRPSETWLTMVRINGSMRKLAIKNLEKAFRAFDETVPFEYSFVDEEYAKNYETDKYLSRLSNLFTLLTIIISCLGLFGLALFTAEQRTKEIGIRKSLGAKTLQVMGMLTKTFLKWIIISFIIASLIAYYAMHSWLEGFVYHTSISWWVFIITGVIAITIALITVSWQAFRAANRNPIQSLRYE